MLFAAVMCKRVHHKRQNRFCVVVSATYETLILQTTHITLFFFYQIWLAFLCSGPAQYVWEKLHFHVEKK